MKLELKDKCKFCKKKLTPKQVAKFFDNEVVCMECYHKFCGDVKEKMAVLLIHHNLLNQRDWGHFHKEILNITKKYYPKYLKGMNDWHKKGKILGNI